MRKYETIVIFDPALSEADVGKEAEKFKAFLVESGAKDVIVDNWGKREISYTLKKKNHGNYMVFYFQDDSEDLVNKINATLRISEPVLKFQTHRIQEQMRKFKGRIQSEDEEQEKSRAA